MRLKNKVAIITGGAEGIGRAYALGFVGEGARVVVADINFPAAQKLVDTITEQGNEALATKTDVSSVEDVEEMVRKTLERFDRVDILVNNAAKYQRNPAIRSPVWEMDPEEWESIIAVNLTGVFLCCRAVLPHMIKQKGGKIINIASISGRGGGLDDGPSYCTSKAGVIQLTQNAAFELGPYGINVNCIAPGLILTPMVYGGGRTREEVQAYLEGRKSAAVLGRLGEPEDIAKVALFLASEDSSFISGQTIPVDGGRTNRM